MSGNFFEKRATSTDGRFFRDLPGRAEADFHKQAAISDWTNFTDDEDGPGPLPTGFHRPANTQPEALEAGGERFNDSQDDAGTGGGIQQSTAGDAKISPPANGGAQMGKNASVTPAAPRRFLGTSFEKRALPSADDVYDKAKSVGSDVASGAKDWASQVGSSAGDAASSLGSSAKDALNSVANNKWAALAALGLGGHVALKGAGKVAKGAGKLLRIGEKAEKPVGMVGRLARKLHL